MPFDRAQTIVLIGKCPVYPHHIPVFIPTTNFILLLTNGSFNCGYATIGRVVFEYIQPYRFRSPMWRAQRTADWWIWVGFSPHNDLR
jgi:hypothetical protein